MIRQSVSVLLTISVLTSYAIPVNQFHHRTPNTSATPIQPLNTKGYHELIGRLQVGDYSANLYNGDDQALVDQDDAAALNDWGGQYFIADHNFQGFDVLRRISPGFTATITTDDEIIYLTLQSVYQGYNTGQGIDLEDGRYAEDVYDGNYIMYTCNDSYSDSVTVTYWKESGSEAIQKIITNLWINKDLDELEINSQTTISIGYEPIDYDISSIQFTSSNPDILQIENIGDGTATVIALSEGDATISVNVDGYIASCNLSVFVSSKNPEETSDVLPQEESVERDDISVPLTTTEPIEESEDSVPANDTENSTANKEFVLIDWKKWYSEFLTQEDATN